MKIWSRLGIAAIAALSSTVAVAASPPAASGDAQSSAASAAPAPGALKDARSIKNDRLHKCKGMEGDEKKACQKDAQADFDKAMGRARTKHAQSTAAAQSR